MACIRSVLDWLTSDFYALFSYLCPRRSPCRLPRRSTDSAQRFPPPDFIIPVPYIAAATSLPATLPTTADIHHSQQILKQTPVTGVVAIGEHFVVKYGRHLNLHEAQMMVFIRQNTRIPVPSVFACYRDSDQSFIVMERIHGQTLEDLWPVLDEQEKTAVMRRLKDYLAQLRRVESPGGYCSLGRGPLLDPVFQTLSGDCAGPFNDETELNDALVRKMRLSDVLRDKADHFYARYLSEILRGHPPTLTHGDLQLKNIMVRPGPELDIVLLDWEYAGWYPSYWEYVAMMTAAPYRGLCRWIPVVLEPYLTAYPPFHMLVDDLS